jgi:hypothetical protein
MDARGRTEFVSCDVVDTQFRSVELNRVRMRGVARPSRLEAGRSEVAT